MRKPGRNRGMANGRNRLTEEDVLFIFNEKTMSQTALAKKFGITQAAINHIKSGHTWSWLTGGKKTEAEQG